MKDSYKVILFYKFVDIKDPEKMVVEQKKLCNALNLKGRILIAEEGINGTLEGTTENINSYQEAVHKMDIFNDLVFKESDGDGKCFTKLSVKVRPEVVTLGAGKLNIKSDTAKEMTADELEELYTKKEDFVVLDLRNDFEIDVGYFEKTYNPKLRNFRDLPQKIGEIEHLKDKKVIAVCTGGIRCEKATCLLKNNGFKDLYQLKDGIHTYMQKYPGKNFKGSLFVFDNRMTTPVVETEEREIVGKCVFCNKNCEIFYTDDTEKPSKKIICCDNCAYSKSNLRKSVPQ